MRGSRAANAALLLLLLALSCAIVVAVDQELEDEELRAEEYMDVLNEELEHQANIVVEANWQYASNITDENERLKNEAASLEAIFTKVRKISS